MKKKEKEALFKELVECDLVLQEFKVHGICNSLSEMRKSKSGLLRVLYESIESDGTSYGDAKLYERFTTALNSTK